MAQSRQKTDAPTDGTVVIFPFDKPDRMTDVTFVIEGKKLHFVRAFLRAASPVFEALLDENCNEDRIPLKGRKYKDVDLFMRQFHPSHSWRPVTDDTLETLLKLANEFRTEHVRTKCQFYISTRLIVNAVQQPAVNLPRIFGVITGQSQPVEAILSKLSVDEVLFYLRVCDEYGLAKSQPELLKIAAARTVETLESSPNYRLLSADCKSQLLRARCLWLEDRLNKHS